MRICCLLTVLFLLTLEQITAQPVTYEVEEFNAEDGLPINWLTHALQDRLGNLWFGTSNGLVRYDGYSFSTYTYEPADSTSLPERFVRRLFQDRDGNLWVKTDPRGFSRFDRETETFRVVIPPDSVTRFINDIHQDNEGVIWIATALGLVALEDKEAAPSRYFPPAEDAPDILPNVIYNLEDDRSGGFWVGSHEGRLYRFDRTSRTFTRVIPDSNPHPGPSQFRIFERDLEGTLWVGAEDGVYRFDEESNRLELIPPFSDSPGNSENAIGQLYCDLEGTLWASIGNRNRLFQYDQNADRFVEVELRIKDTGRPFLNVIWDIHQDRSGILWFLSQNGAVRLDRTRPQFTNYRHDPDNPNGPLNGFTGLIQEDLEHRLWISTPREGLSRFDRTTRTFRHYRHDPSNPAGLSEGFVIPVHVDHEGDIWAGVYNLDGGLFRYEPETGSFSRFKHDPADPTSLSNNEVNAILDDSRGDLWVGTFAGSPQFIGGLNRLDKESGTFTRYSHDPEDSTSLGDPNIITLFEDRESTLWVGSMTKLSKFNRQTERFTNYDIYSVQSILEDRKGRFWVGAAQGLYLFDRDTGTSRRYTMDDGLAHNSVASLVEDDAGFIWIGTEHGLSRLDPEDEKFKNFYRQDGLVSDNFIEKSALRTRDGELFFGTQEGLISFFPESIKSNPYAPEIILSELSLAGEKVAFGKDGLLQKPLSVTEALTLSHDQNDFSLTASALHFAYPELNQYSYMLEHHNEAWTYVGTQRTAIYSNVPPGEYVFHAKAANSDGVWSEPRSLAITILPPWWQTTWAYLVYGLILIGGILTANRMQRQRLINKERQQAQIREAKLETEAARALSREATALARESEAQAHALEEENKRKHVELEKAKELEQAHHALESSYQDLQQAHTRLQETQNQLVHAEKMASLGQLTAGIAHEIKNPLNFINNFARLNTNLTEDIRQYLNQGRIAPSHGRINPIALQEGSDMAVDSPQPASPHSDSPQTDSPHPLSPRNTPTLEEALEALEMLEANAEKIAHHGERADGIVRAMLEHSRTGPGERRAVDLNKLLDEYVNLAYHGMRARVESFHVDLIREYDEAIGEIEVSPQEMGRVFMNLLSNAFDAVREREVRSEEGGVRRAEEGERSKEGDYEPRVSVRTHRNGDQVEIRVSDNGAGIPKEIRGKIFDPFFTTKPTGSGTGLGLSLSHDIVVKGHGGSLTVESEEGEGAEFLVRLPV